MKVSFSLLTCALFAQATFASWGSTKLYNKWHETELERWLSDHDISYPTAADRKLLESLVKENWEGNVVSPYSSWDPTAQKDFLVQKGVEVSDKQAQNKDWLIGQLKKYWYETEDKAESGYADVKSWIFDTWTDSELKSFLDYNNIPNPSPRKRDSMISTARANYATIAKKAGENAAYPGDWLYQSWSDSDLKAWLDTNGIPAPQTSSRDKLVAAVRRNSRQAGLKYEDVKSTVADKIFGSWSDSELKEWFDKNNIPVPQNGKRDEYLATARKYRASLTGDTFSQSVLSAYGAATTSAGNAYGAATDAAGNVISSASSAAKAATDAAGSAASSATDAAGNKWAQATDAAAAAPGQLTDAIMTSWSESRLKEWLDSRGVPVPQNGKKDELLALARLHKHKAANGYGAWTFDTWTVENLREWLKGLGHKVEDNSAASRDELVASASSAYAAASTSGGSAYASVTSAFAMATDYVKDTTFDTWSDSDLKSYLDSYGVETYQGTTRNEMIAKARRYSKLFSDGFKSETAFERYQRQGWAAINNLLSYFGARKDEAAAKAQAVGKDYASAASASASSLSKSGTGAAAAISKSAASAASAASKSASSAASIISKHASSAKSEL